MTVVGSVVDLLVAVIVAVESDAGLLGTDAVVTVEWTSVCVTVLVVVVTGGSVVVVVVVVGSEVVVVALVFARQQPSLSQSCIERFVEREDSTYRSKTHMIFSTWEVDEQKGVLLLI